jgi:hypothetical protein
MNTYFPFAKGVDYNDIIDENTTKIFAYNNILTEWNKNTTQQHYIYDGLNIKVNLCVFYLYNNIPQYLIYIDELTFPNFEYVVKSPPLGKDDNDMFINKCNEEFFILFNFSENNTFNYYKGYVFINGEIYVFFHITHLHIKYPRKVAVLNDKTCNETDSTLELSAPDIYYWALISQIIKHTPLTLFYHFPQLSHNYMNVVIGYGTGKREEHPIFGYFYYFIYDNNLINSTKNTSLNKFILIINTKRFLNTKICKNNTRLIDKSLMYNSFFFNEINTKRTRICIKDYTTFIPFAKG